MSTTDRIQSARIHGEALLAAERSLTTLRSIRSLRRPAEVTVSPHDRAQAVGDIAGEAFAHLPHRGGELGYRLLAAGLLMVSGVIDYDRLGPALRAASDRASSLSREPTI